MGFFGPLLTAVLKTVTLPVAVAKDAGKIVVGLTPDSTKKQLESAARDVDEAFNGF